MKAAMLVAVVVVTGVVAPAGRSAAALTGRVVVNATSALDSTSAKSLTISCPNRTVAIGGGGWVEGDEVAGNVHLDGIVPARIGAGIVTVSASERADGYADDWRLHGSAICIDEPSGYEMVSARSVKDSNFYHTAIAACPPGKQLIGFGGQAAIETGAAVALIAVIPDVDLTEVLVQAYEEPNGYSKAWSTHAVAVCADPIPGLHRVVAPEVAGPDAQEAKSVGEACQLGGWHLNGFFIAAGGKAWMIMTLAGDDSSYTFAHVADQLSKPVWWALAGYSVCLEP